MPTPSEIEHQEDELAERLTQGKQAQALLQDPLIESFFAKRFHANYLAFERLPYGATLEQYQTVHYEFKALKDLRAALQKYITRAEVDALETKQKGKISENIGI